MLTRETEPIPEHRYRTHNKRLTWPTMYLLPPNWY